MCAKFGCGPTVVSKKRGGGTDRQTKKTAALYRLYIYVMVSFVTVTRMDKIRNEYIRGTAQVGRFGKKTREARLRWYGHVRRKYDGYIGIIGR